MHHIAECSPRVPSTRAHTMPAARVVGNAAAAADFDGGFEKKKKSGA